MTQTLSPSVSLGDGTRLVQAIGFLLLFYFMEENIRIVCEATCTMIKSLAAWLFRTARLSAGCGVAAASVNASPGSPHSTSSNNVCLPIITNTHLWSRFVVLMYDVIKHFRVVQQ